MKKLYVLFSAFICLSAQASESSKLSAQTAQQARTVETPVDPGAVSNGVDYFLDLQRLFWTGRAPTAAELIGWNTGRCYTAADRIVARNSVLAGYMEPVGGDGGPLFPGQEVLKFALGAAAGKAANAYDTLTPEVEAEISAWVASQVGLAAPYLANDALVVQYDANTQWHARVAQGYLVVELRTTTGSIEQYCYHFNKLK